MKTLLAVHEIEQSIDSIRPVIKLAKEAGFHLNVVILGIIKAIPVTAAPGVPAYYYNNANDELVNAGKDRADEVEAILQKENISASVSLECRDLAVVEETILKHAMFADATVFTNQTVLATDLATRIFNGALLNSGTPVIVVGPASDNFPDIKKVMYAWNGEREAAKALHQSLTWINGANEAHVVLIDPDEYQQGPNPGDDVAAYLSRQNLAVTVDRLPGGRREISEVLLEHAMDINADIIVMGAYSHSRLRQWLLGGTTRDVLQSASLPVLMAN